MLKIIVAAAAALAVASPAVAAPPERIPVDVFAAPATYDRPEISPDGRQIVAAALHGDTLVLSKALVGIG